MHTNTNPTGICCRTASNEDALALPVMELILIILRKRFSPVLRSNLCTGDAPHRGT